MDEDLRAAAHRPAHGHESLWHATLPGSPDARPPLPGPRDVDVAIVGGGFTGLWTAYYLLRSDPGLRVVVLERETVGFGASGRNGGWCSALFPTATTGLERRWGRDAALRLVHALQDTVDEVARVTGTESISCDYAKGGTLSLARTPLQLERAHAEVVRARRFGLGEDDLRLLGATEAAARCGATDVRGALFTPHCAALHPARLVRGLAAAVERRGAAVHEQTPVKAIRPRAAETGHGTVRAEVVVRATEGYTPALPGHRRVVAPVYSLMVATEPLPPSFWDDAGLSRRETFTDLRHLIVYGQRTADDRLAFGGRGAPYHYGSRVRPAFDHDPRVFRELRKILAEMFPGSADAAVTHAWGGPLGIPRDWHPSVGLDRGTGLAWAGGYVGDGVALSNLAGRTLADLVLGRDTELTALPWVGHRSPRWEPEPLRWLGVNAGLRLMTSADAEEARTGRSSRRAHWFGWLAGR